MCRILWLAQSMICVRVAYDSHHHESLSYLHQVGGALDVMGRWNPWCRNRNRSDLRGSNLLRKTEWLVEDGGILQVGYVTRYPRLWCDLAFGVWIVDDHGPQQRVDGVRLGCQEGSIPFLDLCTRNVESVHRARWLHTHHEPELSCGWRHRHLGSRPLA